MADDLYELVLEGASTGIDHYEKVYDPLKERVKKLPNPIKSIRRGRDGQQEDYDDYGDDESPPPDNPDRRLARQPRSSRAGEGYIDESYERRMGRARSTGRDAYQGGGRGLNRDGRSKSGQVIPSASMPTNKS